MARLGYHRYVAQGGDWGSGVTTALGALDTEHCAAIHVTLAMGARPKLDGELSDAAKRTLEHLAVLPRLGLGLLKAAGDTAPNRRLRPCRFTCRTGCLDPREVLGVDRHTRLRTRGPP